MSLRIELPTNPPVLYPDSTANLQHDAPINLRRPEPGVVDVSESAPNSPTKRYPPRHPWSSKPRVRVRLRCVENSIHFFIRHAFSHIWMKFSAERS